MLFLTITARYLYSLLMVLLAPVLLVRLLWKARINPAYKSRIKERFGFYNQLESYYDVWIHAVSLGEVIAARPIIDALLTANYKILVTTTTPTGSNQVAKQFQTKVGHCYLPLDISFATERFFKAFQFQLGVIMETELWPNLIYSSYKHRIPLLLVNARLSENSLTHYQNIKFLMQNLLLKFDKILAQSELDAQRFINLGADPYNVVVAGNIKFDQNISIVESQLSNHCKELWGGDRVVVIAASTHAGEEEQLLSALSHLQTLIPSVILLIAPRHPERFELITSLSKEKGYITSKRSQPGSINFATEVCIIDSLGELLGFYQLSNYAFIGGSLVDVGGHNILEPIALDIPVFTGAHMKNFSTIYNDLKELQAIITVGNGMELADAIWDLHANPNKKLIQITQARSLLNKHKGALKTYTGIISSYLKKP